MSQLELTDAKQQLERAKNDAIREIRDIANRLHTSMILIDDKLAKIPYMRDDLARIRDDLHEIAQQLHAKGLIEINMGADQDPKQQKLEPRFCHLHGEKRDDCDLCRAA